MASASRESSSKLLTHTEHRVLRYILTHEGVNRNDLCDALQVSMPTIAGCLKRLEELRYVYHDQGKHDSTGGRRADAYSFAYSRCICIGVLVRGGTVQIVATNLRGDISTRHTFPVEGVGTGTRSGAAGLTHEEFYTALAHTIELFITQAHIDTRHLRGIGVTVSSTAALDDSSELRIRHAIEDRLSYPVRIMREPLALAAAETLFSPDIDNAACLFLNATMSSALIRNHRYVKNSSFIEHMCLDTDGPQCYCGQKGCAHMYCNTRALLHAESVNDTTLRSFMEHVRAGSYTHQRVFDEYLDSLALLIHNIGMVQQIPIIVGGEVASLFDSTDISELRARVQALAPRTLKMGSQSVVIKSVCDPDQAIIGAAYVLAQDYLDSLYGQTA